MYQAWLKSMLLQVTLWSQPYIKEGDFQRCAPCVQGL
jgi:hypothetical protein